MSTLQDRSGSALLVIDVQKGVVANAWNRDAVVANIAHCVDKARANDVPVIWVQHSDEELPMNSEQWNLVDELAPASGEAVVHKTFRSSFDNTDLEARLAALNAEHLIVAGAQTNFCVRSTTYAALDRGYDVTLVADAHTTDDIEWNGVSVSAEKVVEEANLTLGWYDLPGRQCRATTTDKLFS